MCPILACQIEMGQLILSPLNLGLKFIRSSLLFFRSSNLDRNYTTNSPGSPACRLHPIGFLSFYYHVSQCFIINVSQLIDRWEIGAVFFWRTLIYRLKSVLKIWENNPCISLLLPFFSCSAMLCLATGRVWLFATPWRVVHQIPISMGILQARILEWVAMPSSRGSSQPGIEPKSPTLQTDSSPSEPPGKLGDYFLPRGLFL